MLEKSLHSLYRYIKQEEYGGWDIFDGLNSKIFKYSPFYRSQILRLAWIQFFKRSPINFRRLALVPKGYNAKEGKQQGHILNINYSATDPRRLKQKVRRAEGEKVRRLEG